MSLPSFPSAVSNIKNAYMSGLKTARVRFSKLNKNFLELLLKACYIKSYHEDELRRYLIVELRYSAKSPGIRDIKLFSKPGCRFYSASKKLPVFYNGLGIVIVSTSQGLMLDSEARKKNIGGEVLVGVF